MSLTYPSLRQSLILLLFYFIPPGLILFLTITLPQLVNFKISVIYITICSIIAATAGLVPLILYINKQSGIKFDWSVQPPSLKTIFFLFVLASAILIISDPFTDVKEFINGLNDKKLRILVFKITDFDINRILILIGTVFLTPIFEEIVFRKQLIEILLIKYKPIGAIIISALLFAFVHLNINDVVALFFWGLIFGIVYYKTRAVEYSILLHSFSNFPTFITEHKYNVITGLVLFKLILTVLISVLIMLLILRYLKKVIKNC